MYIHIFLAIKIDSTLCNSTEQWQVSGQTPYEHGNLTTLTMQVCIILCIYEYIKLFDN